MDLLRRIMPVEDSESIDTNRIDLSNANTLNDCDESINIETNFKLFAGPGAGKTRFLINHINNVLANSVRLKKVKKVACITYTNIGVETIIKRLDNSVNEVEVSTIHSFLYNHVIKPYLWVTNNKYNIPLAKVDGHYEIIPTYGILKKWIEQTRQQHLLYAEDHPDLKELIVKLKTLEWLIQPNGSIELKQRGYPKLKIRNSSLIEYKKICWKNGLISHDDVLYLSYEILKENERVLEILRAKFPYIFIDEFQDTNTIRDYKNDW